MGIIRFLLAVSVLLWHIPDTGVRGFDAGVAVIAFYIVSGFYMALVLNEKYATNLPFWKARLLRLFPIYFAFLVVIQAWDSYIGQPTPYTSNMGEGVLGHLTLIFVNTFILGQDLYQSVVSHAGWPHEGVSPGDYFVSAAYGVFGQRFFEGSAQTMMIGQAWSLSVELWFYGVAPFFLRSWPRFAVGIAVATLVHLYFVTGLFPGDPWAYRLFPGAAIYFFVGALAYKLSRTTIGSLLLDKIGAPAGAVAVIAFIVLFGYGLSTGGAVSSGLFTKRWDFYAVFAFSLPFVFHLTKNFRYDRLIGELSYPLYIVQGIVIGLSLNWIGRDYGLAILVGSVFTVSVIISVVLMYFVEYLPRHLYAAVFRVR